jgi:hypothetical protein
MRATKYPITIIIIIILLLQGGRDSPVGIATRYGLDGPGIESWWGEIFRSRPHRPWGPPSLLYNGYRVSFPGVKRPGLGVDHPPPSSARERVEVYRNSPTGPSWLVLERTLLLPLLVQVVFVLRDFVLRDFALTWLESLHHFSSNNFRFNEIWHRRSVVALIESVR